MSTQYTQFWLLEQCQGLHFPQFTETQTGGGDWPKPKQPVAESRSWPLTRLLVSSREEFIMEGKGAHRFWVKYSFRLTYIQFKRKQWSREVLNIIEPLNHMGVGVPALCTVSNPIPVCLTSRQPSVSAEKSEQKLFKDQLYLKVKGVCMRRKSG